MSLSITKANKQKTLAQIYQMTRRLRLSRQSNGKFLKFICKLAHVYTFSKLSYNYKLLSVIKVFTY